MAKILLIMDSLALASIFRQRFAESGWQAMVAVDGQQGILQFDAAQPDVVLLDSELQMIPPVDVVKYIRSHATGKNVPILAFSNPFDAELSLELWEMGATHLANLAAALPDEIIAMARQALPLGSRPKIKPLKADESNFTLRIIKTSLQQAPQRVEELRQLFKAFADVPEEGARLDEFKRKMHDFTGSAGVAGLIKLAIIASSVEALLRHLSEVSGFFTSSWRETIPQALDCLEGLVANTDEDDSDLRMAPSGQILFVDDDEIICDAASKFLTETGFTVKTATRARTALKMAQETVFDLCMLDIMMPEMNGFELCSHLRCNPEYQLTPILFLTGALSQRNLERGRQSGGTDFLAKPFLHPELAIKTLVWSQAEHTVAS